MRQCNAPHVHGQPTDGAKPGWPRRIWHVISFHLQCTVAAYGPRRLASIDQLPPDTLHLRVIRATGLSTIALAGPLVACALAVML
ncbi:hypothetical protein [Stenotrophomonas sp. NPDC077659]|uniref:hypothetical protein n=1 Tax=Stenotrophomonas sp. NPDC077659 TaxID=3390694 RepID=UPI003D085D76